MDLFTALCGDCIPRVLNFDKYDVYGDKIEPELCPKPKVIEKDITSAVTQEIKQIDTAFETQELLFTTKNINMRFG